MDINVKKRDFYRDFLCLHKVSSGEKSGEIHTHDSIEILIISSGKGQVIIGKKVYGFENSCICIIPSNISHGIICMEKGRKYERYTMNFSESFLCGVLGEIGESIVKTLYQKASFISREHGIKETDFELGIDIINRIAKYNLQEDHEQLRYDLIVLCGYLESLLNNNPVLYSVMKEFNDIRNKNCFNERIKYSLQHLPYSDRTINRALSGYIGVSQKYLMNNVKYLVFRELNKFEAPNSRMLDILEYKDSRSIKRLRENYQITDNQEIESLNRRRMYLLR
ncbi:AraC family ligand binding domain-containing protein [Eubacterium xylanophilum]|uniref:AraC family ligand binding domain-containing protein n=1 Tax=Eubacterium xylanophilum TaxID=39497 RepID=UPI000479A366|nr:AraC family ligand binding domain-containing protein [Eubacterium xylanophilum]